MTAADSPSAISVFRFNLETGMERDEDGVVLGSTRLPGSQRLHQNVMPPEKRDALWGQ
jgi:hypothetical protein